MVSVNGQVGDFIDSKNKKCWDIHIILEMYSLLPSVLDDTLAELGRR